MGDIKICQTAQRKLVFLRFDSAYQIGSKGKKTCWCLQEVTVLLVCLLRRCRSAHLRLPSRSSSCSPQHRHPSTNTHTQFQDAAKNDLTQCMKQTSLHRFMLREEVPGVTRGWPPRGPQGQSTSPAAQHDEEARGTRTA